MAKIRVKLNHVGINYILRSDDVRDNLLGRAARIEAGLPTADGEEWETKSFQGRDRVQVIVKTSNAAARESSAERNSLMHGLASGR